MYALLFGVDVACNAIVDEIASRKGKLNGNDKTSPFPSTLADDHQASLKYVKNDLNSSIPYLLLECDLE
jgi:hypothetical protein